MTNSAGNPAKKTPGRSKAEQREETVRALTSQARSQFAERGYSSVSLADVVEATGLTKGALYHHFPGGKEDLFRAVVEDVVSDVSRRIEDAVGDEDPWTQLIEGGQIFLEACADSGVYQILLVDAPSVLGLASWHESPTLMRGLVFTLTQLAVMGSIAEETVEPLAYLLYGALNGAAQWVVNSPGADPNLASSTLAALLDAYRKEATVVSKGVLSPQWSPSGIGTWFGSGSGRWWFDPGSLSLDFAHAGSMPETPEQWERTEDLERWIARRFRGQFKVTKRDLAKAKQLRDALALAFVDHVNRRKIQPGAAAVVNGFASGGAVVPQLGGSRKPGLDQVLAAVAQDGVSTLTDNGSRVRRCQGCIAVYLDRTPQKTRRWCAWDRCALN